MKALPFLRFLAIAIVRKFYIGFGFLRPPKPLSFNVGELIGIYMSLKCKVKYKLKL
jgi:hypothetical protein